MNPLPLPRLPRDWELTRATLHNYANAMGVVARAHAIPHPRWWHISLKVVPTGLVTDMMPLPAGGRFWLRMDFGEHAVVLETSDGAASSLSMTDGRTGVAFGDALLALVADLGLDAEYAREKFEDSDLGEYRPDHAEDFFAALTNIEHNLQLHRVGLEGPVSPLQIWPHGFDLAFEWFGAGGAQLNLGWYPARRSYFYSNPWPFDRSLTEHDLPAPAAWYVGGDMGQWEGSILFYDDLLATDDPARGLLEYAAAVHGAAAPGLLGDEA